MSTVPYTFATASGNVPASQLDANFANVKASVDSAATVRNPAQPNIASVGTLVSLNVAGNVTAANFVGNFIGSISNAVFATTATTATTSNRAATVTTSAQPNITSVGTLTLLNVSGNVEASGASFSSNVTVGNIFAGNYYWANGVAFSGGTGGTPSGSNTQVQFNDNSEFGGTSGLTFNKNTNALTVSGNVQGGNLRTTGIISAAGNVTSNQFIGSGAGLNSIPGANVTGTVANATYATSAGSATSATTAATVTTAAQPNITSVGTLTSVSVSGNVQGGNLRTTGQVSATGNITGGNFIGNGSSLSSITGANVTGTVSIAATATTAATVTTAAQPNITSVGTLTSVSVTGNVAGGNLTTAGQVSATGNITANNFISSGVGNPTLSSTTNLDLSAVTAVRVTGGGTFRLPSLNSSQIANLTPVNGDMIYNSTVNKIQGFQAGAWGNLI